MELAFHHVDRIGGPWVHGVWWGIVPQLVFFALIVVGIVLLVRYLGSRPGSVPGPAGPSGPLRILEERFARGEIDEEEFRTRREALRS